MSGMMGIGIVFLLAYLLGSLPSADWICRLAYGTDIRSLGSRNPGMTNVLRVHGWKPALPVALFDTAKGFLAAFLAAKLQPDLRIAMLAGLFAVLGHTYTVFAGFKGGKGVLTGFGVFLFFVPVTALLCLLLWAVLVAATRYVSLGSLGAAFLLPLGIVAEYFWKGDRQLLFLLLVALPISTLVIVRHRANIRRLLAGTESRLGRRAAAENPEAAPERIR